LKPAAGAEHMLALQEDEIPVDVLLLLMGRELPLLA
jgi:hypothetical protein